MVGSYAEDLSGLYQSEQPDSLLRCAALAVCFMYISLEPGHMHFRNLAIKEYPRAIRLVRSRLSDPEVAYQDAFLMAMLCLGTY